jgi:hypothetical protein
MKKHEFTTVEIEKVEEALNLYQNYGESDEENLDNNNVVRTYETTDDFKNSPTSSISNIKRGYLKSKKGMDWTADLIEGFQYKKGDSRLQLLVVDLGSARAIAEF